MKQAHNQRELNELVCDGNEDIEICFGTPEAPAMIILALAKGSHKITLSAGASVDVDYGD